MHRDVVDLRTFYDTSLGQVARRLLRRQLREIWPNVRGQVVLGLGYATPFLRPFRDEADRVIALMPAAQGVTYWPREGPGATALVDDETLPLPDMSVDRLLMVHCVEATLHLRSLLREAWRVLDGGGRLVAIVPNRTGLWARIEHTPFGHGHPYSVGQLSTLLRESMFVPEQMSHALHLPPLRSRFMLASAPAWENIGRRWFPGLAGVTVIEASKQLYAHSLQPERPRRRLMVALPKPAVRHVTSRDQQPDEDSPSDPLGAA